MYLELKISYRFELSCYYVPVLLLSEAPLSIQSGTTGSELLPCAVSAGIINFSFVRVLSEVTFVMSADIATSDDFSLVEKRRIEVSGLAKTL